MDGKAERATDHRGMLVVLTALAAVEAARR
jgi:hypothetical protein